MSKKVIKINEKVLRGMIVKAINECYNAKGLNEEEDNDEKEKVEVNTDQEQWHNEYVNNDDNDVVQARVNPESGKEEYKIPTRDTVFTTKDAAISALNEENTNNIMGKVVKLNESKLNEMVGDILNEMMNEYMGLDPRYIKNELGIEDDDTLNAAEMAMDEEDLEFEIGRAIKSLVKDGGKPSETPIDYKILENMLLERFGFRYVGPNAKSQSLDFRNDKYILKLYPHYSYIAPSTKPSGKIIIYNFHVYSIV